jgi:hypothetical protein
MGLDAIVGLLPGCQPVLRVLTEHFVGEVATI